MSESTHILLFSYGTLQLAQVQLSSFGRFLDGEEDAMTGYRTDMIEITDPEVLRRLTPTKCRTTSTSRFR